MRIPDGAAVVGNDVRNLVFSHFLAGHLAELEFSFLIIDSVSLVAAFDVQKDAEFLVGSLQRHHVHDSQRIAGVSSDFSINLHKTFLVLNDGGDISSGKGVLETLLQENSHRDALTEFVRSSRWSTGVLSVQFANHPA